MLERGVKSRRIVHASLAALLLSVGLSACGGSNSGASPASDAASSSGTPSSAASSSTSTTSSSSSSSASSSTSTGSSSSSAPSSTTTPAAKSVTLSWSAPTKNSDGTPLTACATGASGDCLAGYTLHYGTSSQDLIGEIQITDPTSTSYVLSDTTFPAGTYYFTISAYNGMQGSSPMSSEVQVSLD